MSSIIKKNIEIKKIFEMRMRKSEPYIEAMVNITFRAYPTAIYSRGTFEYRKEVEEMLDKLGKSIKSILKGD